MDLYEKKQLQYRYIFIGFICVCIAIVLSSYITYYYYRKAISSIISVDKEFVESSEESEQTIEAIAKSLKSFRRVIDNNFKGEIDESKLLDGAIKGYIDGLGDKYTEYMTKGEWDEFEELALGDFEGIGIYVALNKDNNVVILSVIEDSPAEAIGLKEKDIIVEVDGENVLGVKDASEVTTKVKGPAGTNVHLKIARGTEFIEYDIKRAVVKIYHVEYRMLENNIGYISLYTFDSNCKDEVEEAIKELEKKGAKKLILDLRSNTGGYVSEAFQIADFFLEKGKEIIITETADGKRETTYSKNDPITNLDLVVLVNEYTASSSEILAGTLKDNGRAKIVGMTTYGKGVIQQLFPLVDGSVLKVTVAEYFTPSNTKINEIGITPDYEIDLPEVSSDEDFVDTQLNKAKEILNNKK